MRQFEEELTKLDPIAAGNLSEWDVELSFESRQEVEAAMNGFQKHNSFNKNSHLCAEQRCL